MTFSIYYRKKRNQHLFQSLEKSDLGLENMQNYIPIYNRFFSLNDTNKNGVNLNSYNYITHYMNSVDNHIIKGKVMNSKTEKASVREIFIKYGPLLDPLKYVAGKYELGHTEILPHYGEKCPVEKMDDVNNSAYVDAFMTYLTSNILHHHNFYHGLDFYGSFIGIKKNFEYDMIDDIEMVYNNTFFHKHNNKLFDLPENFDTNYFDNSSRNYKNRITIGDDESVLSITSFESDVMDVFKMTKNVDKLPPINNNACVSIYEAEENNVDSIMKLKANKHDSDSDDDASSTSSCSFINGKEDEGASEVGASEGGASEVGASEAGASASTSDIEEYEDDSQDSSMCSDESEEPLIVRIHKFPCQAIFLEKCHDTLDSLMVNGDLSEKEWISALFQVIIILYTYQKCFNMTHNDLHTNNVMFIETEKQFLYYCVDGVHYKVPTYGRIYKIIDFGRAIYKYEDHIICSDSYHPEGDAGTQYNCAPYFNKNKPKLEPNMSFDLCRLACSIYDFFIDDLDEVEQMKKMSPTFCIINDWVKDDKGRNILYKQSGEERYPDFKLYKMIARSVHNHSPKDQFQRPQFEKFKIAKKKINKKAHIMNIDKLPIYFK